MSNWTSTKSAPRRVGWNIVVTITYTDGETIITEDYGASDLSDVAIAEQAYKRINNVLVPGDAALAALQAGPITPAIDAAKQAAQDANIALQAAVRNAQLKALNDPAVDAAAIAFDEAQAALAQTQAGTLSQVKV